MRKPVNYAEVEWRGTVDAPAVIPSRLVAYRESWSSVIRNDYLV